MFLLKILCNLLEQGKCLSIRLRNFHPTLVFTFLLSGGLNQAMRLCTLSCLACWGPRRFVVDILDTGSRDRYSEGRRCKWVLRTEMLRGRMKAVKLFD